MAEDDRDKFGTDEEITAEELEIAASPPPRVPVSPRLPVIEYVGWI